MAGTPLRAITSNLAEGETAIKPGTAEVGTGPSVKEFKKRLRIADIKAGEEEGGESRIGQSVVVRGWVRTVRSQKAFSFIEVWSRLNCDCMEGDDNLSLMSPFDVLAIHFDVGITS